MRISDRYHPLPAALRDPELRRRLRSLISEDQPSTKSGGMPAPRAADTTSSLPMWNGAYKQRAVDALQHAANKHFSLYPFNGAAVTLTFRPSFNGFPLTEEIAEAAIREFLKRLGRFAERKIKGRRLKVIAIREGSTRSRSGMPRLHYHLKIEIPPGMDPENFASKMEQYWTKLDWASRIQNSFEAESDAGWVSYILKSRSKPDYAYAIDWMNTQV